jgi:hypothetical protein
VAGEDGGEHAANAGVVIDKKYSGVGHCSRWATSFRNTQDNCPF